MKKNYLLLICLFFAQWLIAQTTETFETEVNGSTSFTDNGQVFNITSQAGGPFYIQGNYPGTGWNGSSVDNKYIDNSGNSFANMPSQFTISAAGGAQFTLKSMYLFLSTYNLNLNVNGNTLTITGKLGGATQYTASASSGFTTSFAVNNGHTFINMATFGGANNSNTLIDQFVVATTNGINYIDLDAMTWQTAVAPCPAVTLSQVSQTNISCNGGSNGSATVSASGGSGFTYNWSPGNPTGDGTASISGVPAGTWTVTVTNSCGNSSSTSFTITEPAALNATAGAQTNIACNGGTTGSATVAVTGGTPGYTYSWAPSGGTAATATGLAAGTYTVTVTDANSCTDTQSFTITQPAALNATASAQTNIACNGAATGSATVAVTGGTPGYTYSWAPSGGTGATASGLIAGTYTVTVTDANLCTDTQSFTITQPAALNATASAQTNIDCNGGTTGSATVAVTGGTPGYTYSWAPSGGTAATASGLTAGTYTVTVTDANLCTDTQSFTITQPAALTATTSQTNVLCNGQASGTASVIVSGGTAGYTYLWSPSGGTASTATGLTVGAYSVLITDANGCSITRNFTITQPAVLTATTSQVNATCGPTGQAGVTVSGGAGAYTYVWSPSGGTAAIATGLSAGAYSVLITDANGCTLTKNFTITATSNLAATTTQINVSCNGGTNGSATVTPTGGVLPYTYVWSPSGGTAATATGLAAGTYSVVITDGNSCTITKTVTITQPAVLAATTSQVNITCNGGSNGSATVTPTGGTGAYTYVWTPSGGITATATGLTAGAYSVLITDANGCTLTKNVTITQPAALTATTSQVNISCNGGSNGSATVTAAGGTGAYTYVWSPSGGTAATATGLSAGAYSVLITDANGCTLTKNVTITQPAALTATTSQVNISCNGGSNGSATVTAAGGTGAYTYVWSPSGGTAATATGLAAGAYSALITDANGCTLTKNVTITQPSAITATTSQINLLCNGATNGSATVTATGGTGAYTYAWSPSGGTAATATGLSAGAYSVLITDANGCTLTKNVTITQPAALNATTVKTNITCNGANNGTATVTATGGTGAYTYSWSPAGGTAATATGLAPGTYAVTITDANGCSIIRSLNITQPVALTATTTQVNILCNGGATGSATVTATGGTGAYTYLWSPSGGTAATATGLVAGTYSVVVTDANGCNVTQSVTITQSATITATTSKTDVSCNGSSNGSATVIATGGTGAYTYSWSPSGGTAATATGLAAGTYVVTITDANLCSIIKNVTINQPSAITATTSQVNILCNGGTNGSATVTATGGTGVYTYVWSPSGGTAATATGLAAGSYSVLITDANGCTLIKNITITQPTILASTTTQVNVACNGGTGSATVTATGGTGAYTYVWSPSGGTAATATGLAAATYSVVITDANGCTVTKTVTITQPAALTATTTQANVLCNGGTGSATVTATGGTGAYTYAWSPLGGTAATATGLAAGAYSVIVTDANGCTVTKSVTITQPTALTATTTQVNVLCNGGTGSATVTAIGGTGVYTYEWSPSGGTAATATGLAAGTYSVVVTDANGCTVTKTVTITQPTALTATTTQVNVLCNGGTGSATVTATGGTGAYTYVWSPSGGTAATATGLAAGTYSVIVTDANGCTVTQSVTITQPTVLAATTTQTNVSCNAGTNGSATVTVSGGTGAYTYVWLPSGGTSATATGLAAGEYTVTATDANGCTTTQTVTITEPAALTATTLQVNVGCNGGTNGSATVNVSGGTGTYTYAWLPSGGSAATASDLVAGTYTVTVTDANGCTLTQSFTITEPLAIVVNSDPADVITEAGNDVIFTVTADNVGTYQWQYSANGTDWTDITNGGTSPEVSGATTGSLILVNVPASYNGYIFRVQLANGANCITESASAMLTVTNVLEAVNDDFSENQIHEDTGGIAGDVTANDLMNGVAVDDAAITITVTNDGGLIGVTIDEDGNINVPAGAELGTYTITYTICDALSTTNCSEATVIVVVTYSLKTEHFSVASIDIYPNPANNEVFISIPEAMSIKDVKVTVYDLNGRIVLEQPVTGTHQRINIATLESGVYLFNITSNRGSVTKRIIKNKQ
ncbi:T9SS type A sorting domain-containing protein [Flavobacterium zepuense]|nr:T9SS type A sorting domain-containing protein [Flavobacterium zepuense]